MEITRDWLDSISDAKGLTIGQQTILTHHCKSPPFVGKLIGNDVAKFLEKCKGYRGAPEKIAGFAIAFLDTKPKID